MFSEGNKVIECIPNFSEGNDLSIIEAIKTAIESVSEVALLHVDISKAANRTVFTFVGNPEAVCEAAFRAIEIAGKRIDMTKHKGEHPRLGATDVCPLVPLANIKIEEVNMYAHSLAKRIGSEIGIPVYCYEYSSNREYRKSLEQIRHGQYESLPTKIHIPGWEPDYGPREFNPQSGACIVGARNFLVAYNINLETESVDIAKKIAKEVRESGSFYSNPFTGELRKIPGILKNVKAIGWYISDFDVVQVSMNITNFVETPIYLVYETVKERAAAHGTKVTGSELIGLIPSLALLEVGTYYAQKIGQSITLTDDELIEIAVENLQLNSIKKFDSDINIIERATIRAAKGFDL